MEIGSQSFSVRMGSLRFYRSLPAPLPKERKKGRGSKGLGEDGFMQILDSPSWPSVLFYQHSQRVVSPIEFGTNGEEKFMSLSETGYLRGDHRECTFLPLDIRKLWNVVHTIIFYQIHVRTISPHYA
ncbi:hypothetical protein V6N11_009187 [Hibiscus sabdariffa]|uniref:Uncharacterized protein n=1 Tax=Hibiscus sabdariffa TaxID=183260 RepID=A0ABR2PPZ8_9ROSI